MAAIITELIDKRDTVEIVRDQIAIILAQELANQRLLAIEAGKNPVDWKAAVYIERSRPWEALTDNDGDEIGDMPLINVSYDSDSLDEGGSRNFSSQKAKGTFFIDCYAQKSATLQISGDEAASKDAERIAKLARNILMYSNYTYLDLRGIVTRRYVTRREKLKPDIRNEGFENVIVMRLTCIVDYEEYAGSVVPETLLEVFGECQERDTQKILFDINFDYT